MRRKTFFSVSKLVLSLLENGFKVAVLLRSMQIATRSHRLCNLGSLLY